MILEQETLNSMADYKLGWNAAIDEAIKEAIKKKKLNCGIEAVVLKVI